MSGIPGSDLFTCQKRPSIEVKETYKRHTWHRGKAMSLTHMSHRITAKRELVSR